MTNDWDAVIIGGGVAGLSAALMLGRSRRRTLVIDDGAPRNRFAAHMHGVLGHDGMPPDALVDAGRREAAAYGVEFMSSRVQSIADEGGRLRVVRVDGGSDTARAIVVATGVRDELPAVPGLTEEWGRTVLHCPYCHGWEVSDQRLAVLATSAASIHQIELVRQLSDDVTAFTATMEPLGDDIAARLLAREVKVVPTEVAEATPGVRGLALRTTDGAEHLVDAVFTGGEPKPDLAFADGLGLRRSDSPGAPLAVDARGATSHPRVFAAGNVTAPFANVPVSMGSGSMAGAGVNAMLVAEDFADAVSARTAKRNHDWEDHYAGSDRVWSGGVNEAVAAVVERIPRGTALDIGSGEGGDAVWLAAQGWRVTAIDVSPTAVARTAAHAHSRGLSIEARVGDGAASVTGSYDLVLASFLHSWEPDFPRIRMLREAADRVAPGGHLLVVSHAAPPPWADESSHTRPMRSPHEEHALLDLDPTVWSVETLDIRRREAAAPDGTPSHLDDGVLLLRRRSA